MRMSVWLCRWGCMRAGGCSFLLLGNCAPEQAGAKCSLLAAGHGQVLGPSWSVCSLAWRIGSQQSKASDLKAIALPPSPASQYMSMLDSGALHSWSFAERLCCPIS